MESCHVSFAFSCKMNSSNCETAVLGGGESLRRARLPMTIGVHRCPQAQLLCRPVGLSSLTFHCSWKHHANQLSWPSLCQSLLASFLFLLIISSPVSLTTHNVWPHLTWTWSCGSVRTFCSQHSAGMSFLALSWHIESVCYCYWGFPVVQGWRIQLLRQEKQVRSLGQEDPLEEEMATLSSMLAWRIPWTESPGELQSMWSQRVWHDWSARTVRWVLCWGGVLRWEFLSSVQEWPVLVLDGETCSGSSGSGEVQVERSSVSGLAVWLLGGGSMAESRGQAGAAAGYPRACF